jgi:hypothetical protein
MEIDLKTRPRRALQGKSNTRPEYQLVEEADIFPNIPRVSSVGLVLYMTRREVESQWSPQWSRQHSVAWSA